MRAVTDGVFDDRIVKRSDEPSGNVSRVYEPEHKTPSDEELQKNIESKLQELTQLLDSRGEGLGPEVEHKKKVYMQAASELMRTLKEHTSNDQ